MAKLNYGVKRRAKFRERQDLKRAKVEGNIVETASPEPDVDMEADLKSVPGPSNLPPAHTTRKKPSGSAQEHAVVDSDRSVPVAPREFVELCNNLGSLGSSHTKDLYRRISSLEDRLHTHPRFVEGGESAENGVLVGDALRSHGARLEALERRQCSLDEAYEMAAAMAASNTVMDPLAAIKQVRDMQRNLEAKEAKGEVQNLWRSVGELMQANSELAHHHKNLVQRHGDLIQKHDKTVQKLGEITQQLAALKQEQVEQRKTVTATLVHQVDFAKGKITYTELVERMREHNIS